MQVYQKYTDNSPDIEFLQVSRPRKKTNLSLLVFFLNKPTAQIQKKEKRPHSNYYSLIAIN